VIIVPNNSRLVIRSPSDLPVKAQKIAIADPLTVPAGIYTKQYLSGLALWDEFESKMVTTEDVRAVLAAVESGNVDAGFVYKTDADVSMKVKIALSVPAAKGPVICYPVAMIKEAKSKTAAEGFLRYLESDTARKVFKRYGFIVNF